MKELKFPFGISKDAYLGLLEWKLQSSVLGDLTPCSPLEIRTYLSRLQNPFRWKLLLSNWSVLTRHIAA
jgi:hypothetical protein